MVKYSSEQKLKVVMEVVEGRLSQKEAGKLIGACRGDVQKWHKLYLEHGPEGLVTGNVTYDGQFKLEVIQYMHANHISIRETTAKFGIPTHTTVARWERVYQEKGPAALLNETRGRSNMSEKRKKQKPTLDKKAEEDLLAENQRLRMENAYLKKLNALVQGRIQRENGKK